MDIPHEKISWTILESGLKVIVVEMPNFYTVSAGLFTNVGSRFEREDEVGMSHFIEHLLFKGSRKYHSKQISEIVEGRGGVLNAYTAEESSCFYFKTLPQSFYESLDVLVDFYTDPLFDPVELEKERDVIIEELHSYEDQPSSYIDDLFGSVIWKDHPLGNMILGAEDKILKYSRESLIEYFRKYYSAPNTVLAVSGRITFKEVEAWIKDHEYRFTKGILNRFQPFVDNQKTPRSKIIVKDTEQCNLQVGLPCCDRYSPDQWALRVLNTIAGENMSSRLFQEIRENRGLAYHISSNVEFYDDIGFFSLQSGVDAERVDTCVKESLKVLFELTVKLVDEEELNRAKSYLIGQALQDMESTLSYMLWVGDKFLSKDRDFSNSYFCEQIQKVSAQDVLRVARDIFQSSKLNLALIGPYKHNDHYIKNNLVF